MTANRLSHRIPSGRVAPKYLTISLLLFMLLSNFYIVLGNEINYDNGNRRDPMIPLVGPGGLSVVRAEPTDIIIQGIIFEETGNSIVIIADQIYHEGDEVQGAVILKIDSDHILVKGSPANSGESLADERTIFMHQSPEIPEDGVNVTPPQSLDKDSP